MDNTNVTPTVVKKLCSLCNKPCKGKLCFDCFNNQVNPNRHHPAITPAKDLSDVDDLFGEIFKICGKDRDVMNLMYEKFLSKDKNGPVITSSPVDVIMTPVAKALVTPVEMFSYTCYLCQKEQKQKKKFAGKSESFKCYPCVQIGKSVSVEK